MAYIGTITEIEVDGWGTGYKLDLASTSEDGTQPEFTYTYLERKDAEDVLAFWRTGGASMVFLISNLNSCTDGPEDMDEDQAPR